MAPVPLNQCFSCGWSHVCIRETDVFVGNEKVRIIYLEMNIFFTPSPAAWKQSVCCAWIDNDGLQQLFSMVLATVCETWRRRVMFAERTSALLKMHLKALPTGLPWRQRN